MNWAYITQTLGLNRYIITGLDFEDVSMTPILPGASSFEPILIAGLAMMMVFPPAGSQLPSQMGWPASPAI